MAENFEKPPGESPLIVIASAKELTSPSEDTAERMEEFYRDVEKARKERTQLRLGMNDEMRREGFRDPVKDDVEQRVKKRSDFSFLRG